MNLFHGTTSMNWTDARDYCVSEGGILAIPKTKSEYNETKQFCIDEEFDGYWIGLNDISSEGTWTDSFEVYSMIYKYGFNSDGTATTSRGPWHDGNPNNLGGDQDCVVMNSSWHFEYNDVDCDLMYYPLCQYIVDRYFLGPSLINWYDARDYCVSEGGILAIPQTESEYNEARRFCINGADIRIIGQDLMI